MEMKGLMWNLEKWCGWDYLQGRNRDAGIENGLVDAGKEGEGGASWESSIARNTLTRLKQRANGKLLWDRALSSGLCDDQRGRMHGEEGGSRGRGSVYTYSCFTSLCRRNRHSTLNQLSSDLKRLPGASVGKEFACNVGDPGSIPGWGRSLGEGNGNPLQYSCLENPMDRGAWRGTQSRGSQWVGHNWVTNTFTLSI